jgi:hypothetical protein
MVTPTAPFAPIPAGSVKTSLLDFVIFYDKVSVEPFTFKGDDGSTTTANTAIFTNKDGEHAVFFSSSLRDVKPEDIFCEKHVAEYEVICNPKNHFAHYLIKKAGINFDSFAAKMRAKYARQDENKPAPF